MSDKREKLEDPWLVKLSDNIITITSEENKKQIMEGSDDLIPIPRCPFFASFPLDFDDRIKVVKWTKVAIDRMDNSVDENAKHDILTECACQFPKSLLKEIKEKYQETKDLELAHKMLQNQFFEGLKNNSDVTPEISGNLKAWGWGLAGVLEGNEIIATKMPFQLKNYLESKDPVDKRYYYCHCARVKDAIKIPDIEISKTYCYCGAGYYKGIWEEITQQPVKVEVTESVLQGDDVCQIKIIIP